MKKNELADSVNHAYQDGYSDGKADGYTEGFCDGAVKSIMSYETDLLTMAKENWAPEHVKMLKRLFVAVCYGLKYEEVTDELLENCNEGNDVISHD